MPFGSSTPRTACSGWISPPEARNWYSCAIAYGLWSTAPRINDGLCLGLDAGEGADQAGRRSRIHLHADLAPWPGCRTCASASIRRTLPWLRPSELPGVQVRLRPRVTVTGESSTQLASEYLPGCANASRYTNGFSSEPTGRCASTARLKPAGEGAAADHREHVAVVHVGHHQTGLQRRAALVLDRLQRARDRAFGVRLRRRRHAAEHAQAGARQRICRVVAGELPADQVDIGREAVGDVDRRLGHAQRRVAGALEFGVVDQAGLVHLAEREVAAFLRTSGIAPRIVGRGALDDADQQRDLFGGEVAQVAPEPEFGAAATPWIAWRRAGRGRPG